MNANGLINMVMRLVMRKFLSRGIDAGFDRFAGKGGKTANPEAARRNEKQGRETARRAKQAMRVTRRIGRF